MVFLSFSWQINNTFTLLNEETLTQTQLIVFVACENGVDERVKSIWIQDPQPL